MGATQNPSDYVRLHKETLSRIQSLYFKTELWLESAVPADGKKRDGSDRRELQKKTQVWRKGICECSIVRQYFTFSQKGKVVFPKDGQVNIRVLTDKESRHISGWDPDHPFLLPLDFAKRLSDQSRVGCVVTARTPSDHGRYTDLFSVVGNRMLPEFAETTELVLLQKTDPKLITLQVKAAKARLFEGAVIELDTECGYMIRRVTLNNGSVQEVEEFAKYPDGVWIPKQIRSTAGGEATVLQVIDCRVNEPIAEKDVDFSFPEGAQVSDPEKGLFHLWGKDGPAHTFQSQKDLDAYYVSGMREFQGHLQPRAGSWTWPLVWGNVVLLSFLVLFVFWRRRLTKRL